MMKKRNRNKLCVWLVLLFITQTVLLGGCAGTSRSKTVNGDSGQENTAKQESSAEQSNTSESKGGSSQKETEIQNKESEESLGGIVFEAHDMDGNVVASDVFSSSRLTMVNVWATYCNPCLREMPGLGELAQAYDAGEFQIIGIISDVQEESDQTMIDLAADLIEQTGADYPHLLLNESLYYALLTGVSAVPTTFFIDENGVILDTVIGSMDKSEWEERIHALLEK